VCCDREEAEQIRGHIEIQWLSGIENFVREMILYRPIQFVQKL